MKLGKRREDGELEITEVEKGREVYGQRSERELLAAGYKPVCEIEAPEGASTFHYNDLPNCHVQEWDTPVDGADGGREIGV